MAVAAIKDSRSNILKICLFATGCAGIVAEYVLSTLATYMLGNAVLQWTLVISLMLFAMGLGSRLSRHIVKNLLDKLILVEFTLSVLCASSAAIAYSLYGSMAEIGLLIYALSFFIGLLIGLELPLVTRLNQAYEELKANISSVLAHDYFGALVGGLLFAFFALPKLGLTYTPIVLGAINFLVASVLFFRFRGQLAYIKSIIFLFFTLSLFFILLFIFIRPIILYGEQRKYRDRIVYEKQTPYQKIVITKWKGDYWLFLNGKEQFSSYDEERYHEPLVHPAMSLVVSRREILILGGGDGLAAREVLKYPGIKNITLVDIDPAMTQLAATHPILTGLNRNAMTEPRLDIVNDDAFRYLERTKKRYNLIIIDLPDPGSLDIARLYSLQFYWTCRRRLARGGAIVTQATSPLFSRNAFLCIARTMAEAGFSILPYHNQIPTLGEWGWILGVRQDEMETDQLKARILLQTYDHIPTRFLNRDAMISMAHFGKGIFEKISQIQVNTESDPVLFDYYRNASWGVY